MLTQIAGSVAATFISFTLVRVLEYLIKGRNDRREQEEKAERLYKEIESLRQETQRSKMLALKCVITNKELSRQARLDAYDEYKRLGGNSWVDIYMCRTI